MDQQQLDQQWLEENGNVIQLLQEKFPPEQWRSSALRCLKSTRDFLVLERKEDRGVSLRYGTLTLDPVLFKFRPEEFDKTVRREIDALFRNMEQAHASS